jgi:hypothetical protein
MAWLIQPETIITLVGLVISTGALIKKSKKENLKKLAYDIAINVSQHLIIKPLTNDEKRNVAVKTIYSRLPESARKYLKEQDLIEIVNSAYHTYVKPIEVK